MRRRCTTTCLLTAGLLLMASAAQAASYDDRLEQANALLRSGDATKALERYRELQVDYPDAEAVIFGIGCAQYKQADAMAERVAMMGPQTSGQDQQEGPTIPDRFDEAAETFGRLAGSTDADLRANAMFNAGNCATKKAKFLAGQQQKEPAIAAYREAAGVYEALLESAADHARARQNLDHARYEMKLLMQQPDEDEEKPEPVTAFTEIRTEIPRARVQVDEETGNMLELITPKRGDGS